VVSSNDFEIRSSELARDKATSQDVKNFAAQMITDHTAAGEKLKAAMGQAARPADPLSPKHTGMIALLQAADTAAFEPLYIDMQAGAHMEAVSLFRTFSKSGSKSGDDAAVVSFARATLPTLEAHEMHIMEIVTAH
jgi:putative membrane protein